MLKEKNRNNYRQNEKRQKGRKKEHWERNDDGRERVRKWREIWLKKKREREMKEREKEKKKYKENPEKVKREKKNRI